MSLSGEARQQIFQLCQFHLQTPFRRTRAQSKNIEDQLGAVDDFDLNGGFEIPLLRRGECVIHDQHIRLMCFREFLQFLDFAVAKQSGRINRGSDLKYFSHNLCAGACSQLRQFAERLLRG